MKYFLLLAQLVLCLFVVPLQGIQSLNNIDNEVYTALEAFNTPGIAIGVVVNEHVVLSKGYGLRDVEKERPVTENTLFALASGTKPFTSFLLGLLVDAGKVSWNDPVQMYIPEFRFGNSDKFRPVTIRDLLSHCSGLPRHDMLWYNAPLERQELLEKISLLEMNCTPGSRYQYNNMVFTIAGMIYERVMDESWEEGIKKRLLDPLSMNHTNSSVNEMRSCKDFSLPYVWTRNGLISIPARPLLTGPSSSMNSSVSDMCNWLQLLLNGGIWKEKRIMSNKIFGTLTSPQIDSFIDSIPCFEPNSLGLGWKIGDYAGHPVVYHGGITEGFASLTAFLPNQSIGVVLLCNTNSADFHLIAALTHWSAPHLNRTTFPAPKT